MYIVGKISVTPPRAVISKVKNSFHYDWFRAHSTLEKSALVNYALALDEPGKPRASSAAD